MHGEGARINAGVARIHGEGARRNAMAARMHEEGARVNARAARMITPPFLDYSNKDLTFHLHYCKVIFNFIK